MVFSVPCLLFCIWTELIFNLYRHELWITILLIIWIFSGYINLETRLLLLLFAFVIITPMTS